MHPKRRPPRFLVHLLITSMVTIQLAQAADPVPIPVPRPDPRKVGTDGKAGKEGKVDETAPAAPVTPAAADLPTRPPTRSAGPNIADLPMSPIALCDPDGGEAPTRGYGFVVDKWNKLGHRWGSPEFQKDVENFVNDRRATMIDNQSVNGIHKSYGTNQIGKPDLTVAVEARERFFNLTFGGTRQHGVGSVVSICETKIKLAEHIATLEDVKKLDTDVNSCEGAFKKVKEQLQRTQQALNHYKGIVEGYLKGLNNERHKLPSLETEFKDLRAKNRVNLDRYMGAPTPAQPTKFPQEQQASLKAEYEILWGKGSYDNKGEKVDSVGFYSDVLLQTRKEWKKAQEQADAIKKEADAVAARQATCDSAAGVTPPATNGVNNPPAGSHPPPAGVRPPPGTTPPPANQPPAAPPAVQPVTENLPPATRPPAAPPASPPPAAEEPPPSPRSPRGEPPPADTDQQPQKANGAGQFLKNNWMWLAGGAVLIGGGIWLYKKHKKDEEKKAYWKDDANFLPPANSTTSSSSSSSSSGGSTTTVPPGAKLILSSVVENVTVGNTFSVSLAIVDANGVQQKVDGLAVEASCLSPNPCSLDGAKSVSSTGGLVNFTGLKFNQAHSSVTLQFSAPGVASVTTPGSFAVTGGQRQ